MPPTSESQGRGIVAWLRRARGDLRNPFRYPDFMEYGLALAGLGQTLIAMSVFGDLPARPALEWTVFFTPHTWASVGAILAALHLMGLWLPDCRTSDRIRIIAAHLSAAFWLHFVLSISLRATFTDGAMPTLIAPGLVAPYVAVVVAVRLRKEWQ